MQMPDSLSGMPQRTAKAETAVQPPAGAAPQDTPNVTPQEQALYERTVGGALLAIFDGKALQGTVEALKGDDPAQGVAMVTGAAMARVAEAAMRKGQRIPTDVLMHAATEVFENVAEFAAKTGAGAGLMEDPAAQQRALVMAFEEMRASLPPGAIDEQEAQADFAEVQQADKSGQAPAFMQQAAGAAPKAQPPMAKNGVA
jgi:hypothetical protein